MRVGYERSGVREAVKMAVSSSEVISRLGIRKRNQCIWCQEIGIESPRIATANGDGSATHLNHHICGGNNTRISCKFMSDNVFTHVHRAHTSTPHSQT